MNDRINELIAQATFHGVPQLDIPDDVHLEMFAELVVRECMGIVSSTRTWDENKQFKEGFDHARKLVYTEMQKRFGINVTTEKPNERHDA